MATAAVVAAESKEVLPPTLDANSEQPLLFDGTTRLYMAYICPYAQRPWIARNYKGLQNEIKLVPLDLGNRPAWYKEKLYPENKVPSLEHNNEVKGDSLFLLNYIDSHFGGPSLLPEDTEKRKFAEELVSYSDLFNKANYTHFATKGAAEIEVGAAYDKLENALAKFTDGPFFLGQFSLVDIVYSPFIERFQPYYSDVEKYDITQGRPNLAAWLEELNKIDAYTQTRYDPQVLLAALKHKFGMD